MINVFQAAHAAWHDPDVDEKLSMAMVLYGYWEGGVLDMSDAQATATHLLPGRPDKPPLVVPHDIGKRSTYTKEGRAALIHAIAHIEFNAVNLALDAVWRFRSMPAEYYRDWLKVAADEAQHFALLRAHLRTLGFDYGDFPAHDGLWDVARRTAHDVLARMALAPRLLEARGLDASPMIRKKLEDAGDDIGAAVLDIILNDEIVHVAIGNRWYHWLCEQRGVDPVATFVALLREHGAPKIKGWQNVAARMQAGFTPEEMEVLRAYASE